MDNTKNTEVFQVLAGCLPKSAISYGKLARWLLNTGVSVCEDEEGHFKESINDAHSPTWDQPVRLVIEQGDNYFMEGMLYEAREEFRKAVIYLWEKYYIHHLDDDDDVELMAKLKLVISAITWDLHKMKQASKLIG